MTDRAFTPLTFRSLNFFLSHLHLPIIDFWMLYPAFDKNQWTLHGPVKVVMDENFIPHIVINVSYTKSGTDLTGIYFTLKNSNWAPMIITIDHYHKFNENNLPNVPTI